MYGGHEGSNSSWSTNYKGMFMSEEKVNDPKNEEEVITPGEVFNKEKAIEESKQFLADLLLTDPITQDKLFVATNVQMNPDGSIAVVCVKDIDSTSAILYTIYPELVQREPVDEENEEKDAKGSEEAPKAPSNLVGLDGQPL